MNWLCKAYETTVLHANHIFTRLMVLCVTVGSLCAGLQAIFNGCVSIWKGFTSFIPERSSGGRVVKLLACGAKGPGLIPGLVIWIFRDWLSPASKLRYGWKIAKSTLILKTTNQPIIPEIMDGGRGEETYLLGDDSLILSP